MEISGKDSPLKLDSYIKRIQGKPCKEGESKTDCTPAEKGDRVLFSPAAMEFQRAKKVLERLPDVREDKVEEIRQQIENGTYEIKAGKIADKMLAESLTNELLK